jgi:hypothetical protein
VLPKKKKEHDSLEPQVSGIKLDSKHKLGKSPYTKAFPCKIHMNKGMSE